MREKITWICDILTTHHYRNGLMGRLVECSGALGIGKVVERVTLACQYLVPKHQQHTPSIVLA
jgi:hypothetical protein